MTLTINGVEIEDSYAEAFKMWGSRIIITAKNSKWALEAATRMTGFATSVIGCKCEAGIEGEMDGLIKALAAFPVVDLETERPSLEEIFLTYYGASGEGGAA